MRSGITTSIDWFLPGLTEQEVDPFIQEVKTYEHQPGLMFFWGVGPGSSPSDLGTRLERAGAIYDGNYPYMICDLLQVKTTLPAMSGLDIRQVTTQSELEKWVNVLSISNEYPIETTQALIRLHTLQNLKPGAPCQLFLASLDGEPAATSLLMMHGRMAGIFDVSTSPELRGKGIGRAVTLAAMQVGMQNGAQFSGLFSTPIGLGMYKNIGFEVGAAFDIFVWGE